MNLAQLRLSRARWRRRERFRKSRHSAALQAADQARIRKWGDLLREARANIARRNAQIAAKSGPTIITAAQLGFTFQFLWGGKGAVTRGAGHYAASPRAPDAARLVELVRVWHGMHPGGIAYEAIVADDGTIVLGNPMARKSAAVAANNTGMVSICCPGTTGDRIDPRQARSIAWLLDNWHTTKIPRAHRLPRKARGLDWRGHKEHPGQSTACPGAMLPDYKEIWR